MTRARCALALVLPALALPLLPAQQPGGQKYAVLVGINHYQHDRLRDLQYAEADATELADVLKAAGYTVTLLTGSAKDADKQPTKANVEKHLHEALRLCRKGDTALVAFAGHGLQFDGQADAFFCPLDARPFKDEADSLVSLGKVYQELDKSFAGMKVLLVDACRDDPDAGRGSRGGVNADTAPRPPQGVAALFSCRAGERAFEDDRLKHGVFFHHVLQGLKGQAKDADGEVTFTGLAGYVMRRVSRDVPTLIGGGARQSPNLKADYSTEPVLLAIKDVVPAPGSDIGKVKPADGKTITLDLGDGVAMEFVRIPAGEFLMGLPDDGVVVLEERPRHRVRISRGFCLGRYHVTRGQFRRFVEDAGYRTSAESNGLGSIGYNGDTGESEMIKGCTWKNTGFEQTDEHPVVCVSWNDAQEFCKWLAKKSGRKCGLPTEAEWEYACRAGTTTRYYHGDDPEGLARVGNVADGTAKKRFPSWTTISAEDGYVFTSPVGRFKPNGFGLYDMHGNAGQWCQDRYGDNYYNESPNVDPEGPSEGPLRVRRGGSFQSSWVGCGAASRYGDGPAGGYTFIGFRVALRLD
jgi:sulfatase modifying factor 1